MPQDIFKVDDVDLHLQYDDNFNDTTEEIGNERRRVGTPSNVSHHANHGHDEQDRPERSFQHLENQIGQGTKAPSGEEDDLDEDDRDIDARKS